jgi:predicted phage replisome organizer
VAEIKWIKLSTGLPDNRKIKQIRKLPNGDTIALMWVFLMCLAGETNEDGMVYFTPEIPYTEEMLADEFNMEINTVRLALTTFQRFGMIEVVDKIICLAAWEKWQAVDSLATIREQTRKRVAKHREKQKQLACSVTSSVTVTQCNATDIEEDKNKKENKKKEKEIKPYSEDARLNEAILSFIDFRKGIKKPMSDKAIELMLKKLSGMATDVSEQIEILNQSIINGWQGIFPLKGGESNAGKNKAGRLSNQASEEYGTVF